MFKLLLHWILSAIALMIVDRVVPGFDVRGIRAALVAAVVIGLLNATLGLLLKIVTFPLSILTFGLFLLVINALVIRLASSVVRGFNVYGWVPALWGALVLAILGMVIRGLLRETDRRKITT